MTTKKNTTIVAVCVALIMFIALITLLAPSPQYSSAVEAYTHKNSGIKEAALLTLLLGPVLLFAIWRSNKKQDGSNLITNSSEYGPLNDDASFINKSADITHDIDITAR